LFFLYSSSKSNQGSHNLYVCKIYRWERSQESCGGARRTNFRSFLHKISQPLTTPGEQKWQMATVPIPISTHCLNPDTSHWLFRVHLCKHRDVKLVLPVRSPHSSTDCPLEASCRTVQLFPVTRGVQNSYGGTGHWELCSQLETQGLWCSQDKSLMVCRLWQENGQKI
jgi:hypothetical protein